MILVDENQAILMDIMNFTLQALEHFTVYWAVPNILLLNSMLYSNTYLNQLDANSEVLHIPANADRPSTRATHRKKCSTHRRGISAPVSVRFHCARSTGTS